MIDSFYQNPIANITINHEMLKPFPLKNKANFLLNLMCSEIDHTFPSTPTGLGWTPSAVIARMYLNISFSQNWLSRGRYRPYRFLYPWSLTQFLAQKIPWRPKQLNENNSRILNFMEDHFPFPIRQLCQSYLQTRC